MELLGYPSVDMKKLLCFFIVLIDVVALAQLPPYVRNPITTNGPIGMTQAVQSAMSPVLDFYAIKTNTFFVANVKHFGAVGDGTADDTSAFTQAFTNKVVYVPPGTYSLAPLVFTNEMLYGDGNSSILSLRYPTNSGVLITAPSPGTSIRDIHIFGNTNLSFYTSSVSTIGISHNAVGDGVIQNVKISAFGIGLYVYGTNNITTRPQNSAYLNNTITNCQTSVSLANNNGAEYTRFIGNTLTWGWFGVRNNSAANVLCSGNKIVNFEWYGVVAEPSTARGSSLYVGNIVNHTEGFYFNKANHALVACNDFLGNQKMALTDCTNVVIRENRFENSVASIMTGGRGNIFANNSHSGTSTSWTGATDYNLISFGNFKDGAPLAETMPVSTLAATAVISTNGYYFPSNAISAWPTAPRVQGETFIGNSNGWVYMLSSKPGGTGWGNTNRISHQPRWDDVVVSGLALRLGASSPQRTAIMGGIYGQGWDANDDSDFTVQFPHGLARTNAWFPDFHFSPHLHVSAISTNSGTNAAFVIVYQYAKPNEAFGPVYTHTNWVGFTQTNEYRFISFPHHTNNLLSGADSLVVRGNIRCITNNTGARVIVDSADFHVPRVALGSESTLTDD